MQQVAQYIFLFLVGTTVLNFVIAFAARAKTGNKEFNVLVLYWFTLFLNFMAVATFSSNPTEIALAFFFNAPPTLLMAKMLRDARGIKTNWALFIGTQILGAAVSATLLLKTDAGFSYSLIPFILTISWPWVYPIYDSLIKRRTEANWIEKAMSLVYITGLISHFAFAFYRLDESAAWWGWAQAIAHYQCLSIFLPLMINHRREVNERKNLELALSKLSGNRPAATASATEIDELYRSLELQIGQKEEYSRKLSESNAHLEEEREMNEILIKTISHDLANPLTVVSAYMEMISTGRISPDDHEKIHDRMRMNLRSAMDMIARIRRAVVTRNEADLVKVGPVELILPIRRVEMMFDERLRAKNIELRVNGSVNLKVLADENALVEHVFANILSNAVKFSYEKGRIDINITDTGKNVEVEFRDHGVGLSPARHEKNRFISTPGTQGEEGTGFGLIVMGYFLRKFGADLRIIPHTHQGQSGTSFIVILKKENKNDLAIPVANFFS